MNIVYKLVKTLVPKQTFTKKRYDDDFLVLLSPSLELLFLNNVAKDFYDKVDGQRTLEEIVNQLLAEYEVVETILVEDLLGIVRDFQWKGLLVLSE